MVSVGEKQKRKQLEKHTVQCSIYAAPEFGSFMAIAFEPGLGLIPTWPLILPPNGTPKPRRNQKQAVEDRNGYGKERPRQEERTRQNTRRRKQRFAGVSGAYSGACTLHRASPSYPFLSACFSINQPISSYLFKADGGPVLDCTCLRAARLADKGHPLIRLPAPLRTSFPSYPRCFYRPHCTS